jgi:AcrR family transcriptional regulator
MPKVVPEYRAEAKARIAKAARELFAAEGFHRTSMDDIARALGVSKAALYLYFPSKVDILRELQSQSQQLSREWIARALSEADPAAGFAASFDEVFRRALDPRLMTLWVEILGEAVHDEQIRASLRLDRREDLKSIRYFLVQLRERGRLPKDVDIEVTAFTLIALFTTAVWDLTLGHDPKQVRTLLGASIRTLLAPPPGPSRSAPRRRARAR